MISAGNDEFFLLGNAMMPFFRANGNLYKIWIPIYEFLSLTLYEASRSKNV